MAVELELEVPAGRDVRIEGREGLWSCLASCWRVRAGTEVVSRMARRGWE